MKQVKLITGAGAPISKNGYDASVNEETGAVDIQFTKDWDIREGDIVTVVIQEKPCLTDALVDMILGVGGGKKQTGVVIQSYGLIDSRPSPRLSRESLKNMINNVLREYDVDEH